MTALADSPKVSAYVAYSDLIHYLRSNRLGELVNDDGSKLIETQTAKDFLNEALWRTDNVVHGYIGAAYAVPQTSVRSPITFLAIGEHVLSITVYRLFVRGLIRGASAEDLAKAATASTTWFQSVSNGGARLPSDAQPVPATATKQTASFIGRSEAPIWGDPDA